MGRLSTKLTAALGSASFWHAQNAQQSEQLLREMQCGINRTLGTAVTIASALVRFHLPPRADSAFACLYFLVLHFYWLLLSIQRITAAELNNTTPWTSLQLQYMVSYALVSAIASAVCPRVSCLCMHAWLVDW